MNGNRLSGSEKLAGLAFTPVLLTLLVAEGASMEQAHRARADTSPQGTAAGPVDRTANLAVMFGQPVMSDRPVMFEMKPASVAAAIPLPLASGLDPTRAPNANQASAGTPIDVATTAMPKPARPAIEAEAPRTQAAPATLDVAPPAQPETPFGTVEPSLASLTAPNAAPLPAAEPAPAADLEHAMLAASSAPAQPASVQPTAVQTLAIQTPLAPTVVIADWKYTLPSEAHAASVQSFAGQSNDSAAAASNTFSPPTALRKGRAALRSPARLARAQHGALGGASAQPRAKYQMVGGAIEFQLPVQVNGEQLGNVTLHVMPDQKISLQLKELVTLFAPHLDPQMLQALSGTETAEEFVSFDRLRAAGIDIRYDAARDQIRLNAPQP
jgi:hypothetical protein